jgi:iron complex outermembrane receptor protein
MRLILLIFICFGWSEGILAQGLRDTTIRIEEVHVTAKRRPGDIGLSRSRPDSMALVSSMTAQLSDLLAGFSPIFIKTYGNGAEATASFRGTAASHTQLIWNGINLNSPMRGSADLSLMPVIFIDDAWLLHGGSSMTETSGSLGGSIHLSNKPDWSAQHAASLMIERASFNTGRYMAKIQIGKGRFRSVTRLMADHSDNNIPFYNAGVLPARQDTLRNADYLKWAGLQEFYVRLKDEKMVAARLWYQESDRSLPQLMSYEGSSRNEFQDDRQLRAQIEYRDFSKARQVHGSSGFNKTRMHYFREAPDIKYVNDDAVSVEQSWYNRFRISMYISEKWSLSTAAVMNYHRVEAENLARSNGYSHDRIEGGVTLHGQWQATRNLGLFLLNRTEYYDRKWVPIVPSGGFEFELPFRMPTLLKGNLSGNYHKPALNDLYWMPGGNPGLKPEKGITSDLSLAMESFAQDIWKQEITIFYSLIDNWIIWQPSANGAWYWEADNVKKVLSRGVEYQFSSRLNLGQGILRTHGNYAFTRTTNENAVPSVDQSRGKQLIYIPMHSGNLHLSWSCKPWTIRGELSYTGRRYTQSSNEYTHYENVLNPFWVAGCSAEYIVEFGNIDLTTRMKVHNLLDVDYQQILWRPMPGRHYSLTLGLQWKN